MTPHIMLHIHALVAMMSGLLIVSYRRGDRRHKWYYSVLAYLLALAFFSVSIRIWVGDYLVLDRSEVVIDVGFLILLILSKGNVTGKRG